MYLSKKRRFLGEFYKNHNIDPRYLAVQTKTFSTPNVNKPKKGQRGQIAARILVHFFAVKTRQAFKN
jgi:hypothetical protein